VAGELAVVAVLSYRAITFWLPLDLGLPGPAEDGEALGRFRGRRARKHPARDPREDLQAEAAGYRWRGPGQGEQAADEGGLRREGPRIDADASRKSLRAREKAEDESRFEARLSETGDR
jgi:hypothetical protein